MTKAVQLITLIILLTGQLAQAQCTIDPLPTDPGFYPSSLPDGYLGQSYAASTTILSPTDTLYAGFTVPIDSLIISVTGLPNGLGYTCGTPNCTTYGPSLTNCIEVSGVPTEVSSGPVVVNRSMWVTIFGFPVEMLELDTIELNVLVNCTIDTNLTDPGIYPAAFPNGIVNKAYMATGQLVVPADTVMNIPPFGPLLVPIDSVVLSASYIAPGLSLNCGGNCTIIAPGEAPLRSCFTITGTPTTLNTNSVILSIDSYVTILGSPTSLTTYDTLDLNIMDVPETMITGFANISDHGATVQWTSNVTGGQDDDRWVIRHHQFGNSPNFNYKIIPQAYNSGYTNYLTANTQHVYRVGYRAAGNTSASFSDTASVWTKCANPYDLSSERTSVSTAELSWDDSNADMYKVRYMHYGQTGWTYRNVPGPASGVTLYNLEAHPYTWQVRSVCNSGGRSYSAEQTIPLSVDRLAAPVSDGVDVYPNPAKSILTVNVSNFQQVVIHNSVGAIVLRSNSNTLDVNDLAPGVYNAMIYHGGIRTAKRLVIE